MTVSETILGMVASRLAVIVFFVLVVWALPAHPHDQFACAQTTPIESKTESHLIAKPGSEQDPLLKDLRLHD